MISATGKCVKWPVMYQLFIITYQHTDTRVTRGGRYKRLVSHAVTGRGDHTDTGPEVCDSLMQMHISMKQHCTAGS